MHSRMMVESIRQERWEMSQKVANNFSNNFKKFVEFDNSTDLKEATEFEKMSKEEDITLIHEITNWFLSMPVENKAANDWLHRNKKVNIDKLFEKVVLFQEKKYVSKNKTNSQTSITEGETCSCGANKTSSRLFSGFPRKKGKRILDNICPSCQLTRKQGREDSVTDGDVKSNSSYIFRTYVEEREPTVIRAPETKETKFQQDADKIRAKKQKTNYSLS